MLSMEVVDAPNESQLLNALHSLDGERRTQLWLHQSDGGHILVTGPLERRYALDFSEPGGRYCYAIDRTQPDDAVKIPAGNDEVELSRQGLIAAEATERVLLEFLRAGTLAEEIEWEAP